MNSRGINAYILSSAGKIFETSLVDLNKFPDTLLGNHDARKQYYDIFRDEYYFNRNQIAFDSILYYYQTGRTLFTVKTLRFWGIAPYRNHIECCIPFFHNLLLNNIMSCDFSRLGGSIKSRHLLYICDRISQRTGG